MTDGIFQVGGSPSEIAGANYATSCSSNICWLPAENGFDSTAGTTFQQSFTLPYPLYGDYTRAYFGLNFGNVPDYHGTPTSS
jgi:hypothetical protein